MKEKVFVVSAVCFDDGTDSYYTYLVGVFKTNKQAEAHLKTLQAEDRYEITEREIEIKL